MARKLEVEIVGDASSLHRALKQSDTSTSKFGGTLSKLKYGAVAAGAAVGTGLVVGLEKSVHAAIDAQKVNARLEVAFKNAGLSAKVYAKQIEKAESAGRKLGFTDEETKTSLGSLITSTKNYKQALMQLKIAQDLARFKGVSLEAATKALTMAHAGSLRPIKQLGIDVPKLTTHVDALKAATKDHTTAAYANALAAAKIADKQATFQAVLKATTGAVHGQADAYSKTAAGAMSQFHAQLEHIEVVIGSKVLPVMVSLIQYISKNWPAISATILHAWAQIKPTLEALMNLAIAIVATIRKHWNTIGPIVHAVAEVIKTEIAIITGVLKTVADLLEGHWSKAWTDLKATVGNALHLVVALIQEYAAVGGLLWKAVLAIGGAIVHGIEAGLTDAWKGLEKMVKDLFNQVIGWVKGVFGIKSPSTVFHDIGLNMVKGMVGGVGAGAGLLKHYVTHLAGGLLSKVGSIFHGGAGKADDYIGGLTARVVQALQFAQTHGWHGHVTSGYRTYAQQAALYQRYLNGGPLAAKPGTSSHETGQAVDVTDPSGFARAMSMMSASARLFNRLGSADPVHFSVSGYAQGGVVPGYGPQVAIVHGGETIIPANKSANGSAPIYLVTPDGKALAEFVFDGMRGVAQVYRQRTGRPAFGS